MVADDVYAVGYFAEDYVGPLTMATKKVLFFTAGITATSGELASIAALNAIAEKPYEVVVMNKKMPQSVPLRAADYVAGSPPAEYAATPVIDPANPPSGLPATKAVVTNGVALTVPVTGVYATKATPTVVNGVVTAIVLS